MELAQEERNINLVMSSQVGREVLQSPWLPRNHQRIWFPASKLNKRIPWEVSGILNGKLFGTKLLINVRTSSVSHTAN